MSANEEATTEATSLANELVWRPMRDQEHNYVLSSWLRSYAESPEFRRMPRAVYFALYAPVVERLLDRCTVAVASTPDLPDTVIGYLVVEGDSIIHYAHTKRRFRRLGVARWMMRDLVSLPAMYTHSPTPVASRLCGPSWVYDPMRRFDRKTA